MGDFADSLWNPDVPHKSKHEEELQAYLNAGGYICPRCKQYTLETIELGGMNEKYS